MNPENIKTSVAMALAKMIDDLIEIDGVNHVKFKNGALMPLSFDYTAQTTQPVDEWLEKWDDLATINGYYVNEMSSVCSVDGGVVERHTQKVFATKAQADASIAIAQLTQLMAQPYVNGDWQPSEGYDKIWVIEYYENRMIVDFCGGKKHFLAFKDELIAKKFLDMYEDYIIKAAPILFGITL